MKVAKEDEQARKKAQEDAEAEQFKNNPNELRERLAAGESTGMM